ncbi:hypothetical protein PtA15_16A215 [Puccinia triticina]|uniref:Uncharacterized protein n=1 Tax=Puccinia triticina TaxID=208348 RepID=A0ABY7D3V5_9BASI|nr:uncharacterized protein PtA15_16A215 [Puccinia triticina]WAQ92309.1 hypothetical protein PtA15_16A215 [Puccinia triticina]WAR64046.1 hypothetical protein PtB15_16B205 [Puccinia triticina]
MPILALPLRRYSLIYLILIWGSRIVSGGDWDSDGLEHDAWQTLHDLPHQYEYSTDHGGAFNEAHPPQPEWHSTNLDFFSSSRPEPSTWALMSPPHPYPASPDGILRFLRDHEMPTDATNSIFFSSPTPEPNTWSLMTPPYPYPASPDGILRFLHDHEMPTDASTFSPEDPSTSSRKKPRLGDFSYEIPITPPSTETGQSASLQHPGTRPTTQNGKFDDILNTPRRPSELYISSRNGALQTIFLHDSLDTFTKRSEQSVKPTQIRDLIYGHGTLPIGMHVSNGGSSMQLRFQDPATKQLLTLDNNWLYTVLIAWLYDLHQRILDRAKLPAYAYRLQHGKLIDWLNNQIFTPPTGRPIIAMYKSSSPFDWNSHQFSPIQSQLISYFGQPFSANANLSNIATSLLREFLDKCEDEYLASSYDPETSIREPENPVTNLYHQFRGVSQQDMTKSQL